MEELLVRVFAILGNLEAPERGEHGAGGRPAGDGGLSFLLAGNSMFRRAARPPQPRAPPSCNLFRKRRHVPAPQVGVGGRSWGWQTMLLPPHDHVWRRSHKQLQARRRQLPAAGLAARLKVWVWPAPVVLVWEHRLQAT